MALAMAISTAISTANSTASHGKHPRHTTAGRGTTERPTAIPTAHGMEVAMEYAVTVAVVLPWVAMIGTAEVATDRTVVRAMATIVALAVERHVQWKAVALAVETRGFPR